MMCALCARDATRRRGTADVDAGDDAGDDAFLCRCFPRRGPVIQVSIVVDID